MKVIIVGCGLGGLACAIACLRQGLKVVLLERAPSIQPVGAGIQIPPNATRIMRHFGLEDQLLQRGAVRIHSRNLLRYSDGKVLCSRPGFDAMVEDFGASYYVIHRADYQEILLEEAMRLGMDFRTNCEVVQVLFHACPKAVLKNGEHVAGDVLVGADGLWSATRDQILGRPSPPQETGDLAFRGTFPLSRLESIDNPALQELIHSQKACLWMGPDKHCSFYPVRNGNEYNLVLLTPDDLADGIRSSEGNVGELEYAFKDWDPTLLILISCMNESLLKWKLLHHSELERWVKVAKGNVALLGDACHPSLPYQAQGAAMAVEDGAVLGFLLGKFGQLNQQCNLVDKGDIHSLLELYESLRKPRTTLNVQGSIQNRVMFHMHDGSKQQKRDEELSRVDWKAPCAWQWGDLEYQTALMGFDPIKGAGIAFDQWAGKHRL